MKVAIIGSGIGGICSAIRLKKKGFDVDVFEKNEFPGGKLSTFKLGDFRFDAGPSLFTMPHLVDELFSICNENPRNFFNYKKKTIHCKYFWNDGKKFTAYSDKNKFFNEVEKEFNISGNVVKKYLSKAEIKYNLTEKIFLNKSLHKLSTYLNTDTIKALFKINFFQINKTLNKVNQDELKNKYLVQMFNRYATYNGSSPYKTPGMMSLIQHLENHYGTYIPEGGMYEIAKSLYKLANKIGVKFNFNSEITNLKVDNKKIKYIEINNIKKIEADYVISNVDTHHFYHKLLGNKISHSSLKSERSSSAVIFYWCMKNINTNLDLHNIFFASDYKSEFESIFEKKELYNDPTIYVNITSKDVKNDAPKNSENWFVMVNAPQNANQNWDSEIKILKKVIIEKLEKILNININDKLIEEKIYSPVDLDKNTNSYLGSLYGTSSNDMFSSFLRHPNFSRKLKNVFFCGGSVHPGGGIPLCILSSKIISELIEN
jgi:phytoene desaturase|tara:strand:- start:1444 stop:2904 length:1461 start_codon:yes stop_codon:yes gene_type:complete